MVDSPLLSRAGRRAGLLSLATALTIGAGAIASTADQRPVAAAEPPRVTLSHPGSQPRIDVLVDGKPFTSYIWPGTLKKPTLYPIRTGDGIVVTRGFPPAPGERGDHPHHVGLWFNYGDVNGYDFWNHSSAIEASRLDKMGRIIHSGVTRMDDGRGHAELGVRTRWVTAQNGTPLVDEETTFIFRATADGLRIIDRATYLTAVARKVNVVSSSTSGVPFCAVTQRVFTPSSAWPRPLSIFVIVEWTMRPIFSSRAGSRMALEWFQKS